MDLALVRTEFRPDGIFSELRLPSGDLFCVTLEHAYFEEISGLTPKLPDGDFACIRGKHQLNAWPIGIETFEITKVPGHTGILFHPGNFNHDSDGCVLLGARVLTLNGQRAVSGSRDTFERFMKLQDGLEKFQLSVRSD